MPQCDERGSDAAILIADRNPTLSPEAVEAAARRAASIHPGGTPQQHAASYASSSGDDHDGRG